MVFSGYMPSSEIAGSYGSSIFSFLQSEVSQKEKNKYCMLTHICGITNKKNVGLKNLGAGQE